ncbi:hypothetical protein IWX90DRAFT_8919 [Phyllosticta citrichinensis]|uniref:Uncharacterized protein n=1 Tax=Phyllosticta citrichinensis TaxID=1130410 RepID=A0ABR1Y5H8_9PEZI
MLLASHTSKRCERRAVHRARQATAMHAHLALPIALQSTACLSYHSAQPSPAQQGETGCACALTPTVFSTVSVIRTDLVRECKTAAKHLVGDQLPTGWLSHRPRLPTAKTSALLPTICAQLDISNYYIEFETQRSIQPTIRRMLDGAVPGRAASCFGQVEARALPLQPRRYRR